MGMFTEHNNKVKADKLDKNIAELEAKMLGQRVEKPTESTEGEQSESSEEAAKVITQEVESKKEPVQDLEYWKNRCLTSEQRFNVSKPKYDSNIYKLKQENIKLQEDRVRLSKNLNEARQSLQSTQVNKLDSLLDEESVDVLGENVAKKMRDAIEETNSRVARQEQKARDKEILDSERKLKTDIDNEYGDFMETLSSLVKDQAEINQNPKFIDFLNGVDTDTGMIRFELFRRAEGARDAGRVADFFKQFKGTLVKEAPKDSVNKRIAPSSEGSDTDLNIESDSDKMPMSFVKNFYHEVERGKWKGRHKEMEAQIAQIDAYMVSGNINANA